MSKSQTLFPLLLGLLVCAVHPVYAQNQDYEPSEQRSDFNDRRISIMDGNLLRATYNNTGFGGTPNRQDAERLSYEFPRNTNRFYMLFQMLLAGAEAPNLATSDTTDTVPIVNFASFKTSLDGDENWSLNPVSGYFNPNSQEVARSDRGPGSPLGNTWPPLWPDKLEDGGDGWAGSWNGFFGRDQFNADTEFYYRAGDDNYRFYNRDPEGQRYYTPDLTDPTRGGLGLLFDNRVLAWSTILINNVHFSINEVINDASFDYDKVSLGIWIADFVGENAGNDKPFFDELESVAFITDLNRNQFPPFFEGPIGEMALKFLETPGNSSDGIDNDGDSDQYLAGTQFYDTDNVDLYAEASETNGGFYTVNEMVNDIVPQFQQADFDIRTIGPGDKIIQILPNGDRVVKIYPTGGGTFVTQGIEYSLPAGGLQVREDTLLQSQPSFGSNTDRLDNDFDGLIDESTPNHLEKDFINEQGMDDVQEVRFINYRFFDEGDTLQVGLMVPNQEIRERINNDSEFRELVEVEHQGRFKNRFTAAPMIDEARNDFFDNEEFMGGTHGYDHRAPEMRTIFWASGPDFISGKSSKPFQSIHLYELMCKILGITPAENDGNVKVIEHLLIN